MNFSFLLLKRFILFLFMHLCMYVDLCVGTHRSMEKVSDSLELELSVTYRCWEQNSGPL